MKAKQFFLTVAAGVATLLVWELVKPKIKAAQSNQEQVAAGLDYWP